MIKIRVSRSMWVSVFLVIVSLFFTIPTAHAAISGPGSGLLGYWNFDEASGTQAVDISGNNNNGTLRNGATRIAGKINNSLSNDGINDYVSVPQTTPLSIIADNGGGGMTVSFWIRPNTLANAGIINLGQGSDEEWKINLNATGRITFTVNSTGNDLSERWENQLVANDWRHIVLTWNGGPTSGTSAKLYRNGVLQTLGFGSSGTGTLVDNPGEDLLFGTEYGGSTGLNGALDDVRIYDRVLTQAEIDQLYTFTPDGTPPADTIPPVLSAGSPTGMLASTTTSVNLTLTTNENSICRYNTLPNIPYASTTNTFTTTGGTNHIQNISGLTSSTTYAYYVRCADTAGNASQNDYLINFTVQGEVIVPPDTTAPLISNIVSSVGTSTALITWTTDETSTSQVDYGATTSYGLTTTLDTTKVLSHSVTLSNLAVGNTYHYIVRSSDTAGNTATSSDAIFFVSDGGVTFPPGPVPADMYLDMENGTVGEAVTDNIIAGYVHGIPGINQWHIFPIGTPNILVSSGETPLRTPVTVGTTTYNDGGGTRGMQVNVGTLSTYAEYVFDTDKDNVSVGTYLTFGSNENSFATIDRIVMNGNDGGYCVAQTSANFKLRAHARVSATAPNGVGPDITITENKPYWLTIKYQAGGTCMLNIYDPVDWSLVGTSSLPMNSTGGARNLHIGRGDAHGGIQPSAASVDHFDDLIVNWTTAPFPLGPGAGSPPDTIAPTAPLSFTATPISDTQINLSWASSTDNIAVKGYRVYLSGIQIATTTSPTYSHSGLVAETAYDYSVNAYDAAGNISDVATTSAITLPPPPQYSLTVLKDGTGTGMVAAPGISCGSSCMEVVTVGTPVTLSASPSTDSTFTGWIGGGCTGIETCDVTVTATTSVTASFDLIPIDTVPPTAPLDVVATATAYNRIDLTWASSTDDIAVTGYRVIRNGIYIATTTSLSYIDSNVTQTTSYSYNIVAVDLALNNSEYSATVDVTTPIMPDIIPPVRFGGLPSGQLLPGTSSTTLSLFTNEASVCKYGTVGTTTFASLPNIFDTVTGTSHTANITGLTNGTSYNYYARCQDTAGNANTNDFLISFAVTSSSTLSNGLVGYWSFDEASGTTAADTSGNGNTGTLQNGPLHVAGQVGAGALNFDGVNDTVNAGSANSLDNIESQMASSTNAGMTLSFWVKPDVINTAPMSIGKGSGTGSWQVTLGNVGTPGRINFSKDMTGSDINLRFEQQLTVNQWKHIVLVWNGQGGANNVTLYNNNVAKSANFGETGTGTKVSDAAGSLTIGGNYSFYKGALDDVRLYNRTLTSAEVGELYALR